jgi:hypothetical protein
MLESILLILAIVLVLLIVVIITALPLHFGVAFLGGDSTLLKAFIMTLATQILTIFISYRIRSPNAIRFTIGVLGILFLVWLYREVFRLKWIKAFLLWFVYIIFAFIFQLLLLFILALIPATAGLV